MVTMNIPVLYDERNINEFINQLRFANQKSGKSLKIVFDKTLARIVTEDAKEIAIIDLQKKGK
jgi:hypothetical protein